MKKISLCFFIFIFSCAIINKMEMEKELENKVNVMTYDEALIKWGPPDSVVEGDNVIVASWGEERGRIRTTLNNSGVLTSKEKKRGWKLTLVFDKMTNKMIKWDYKIILK